jgi:hypothetical protein
VKKASLSGITSAFTKLMKDAAARHNTLLITPDITGWFFVITNHGDELKKQQLSQLQHLVWFTAQPQLQQAMAPAGLGANAAGVVLPAGPSIAAAAAAAAGKVAAAANVASTAEDPTATPEDHSGSSSGSGKPGRTATAATEETAAGVDGSNAAVAAAALSHAKSSNQAQDGKNSCTSSPPLGPYELPGLPSSGLMLQLGGSSSSSRNKDHVHRTASGAGLQLHVGTLALLDELVAGARYSQAAYGYVAAAGHLHSISNAIKLLATLPLFDPITGGWVGGWVGGWWEGTDQ